MRLEQEQVDLLTAIVEYHRSVPRDKRDRFWVMHTMGTPTHAWYPMMQDGWQMNVVDADLEVLASYGLIGIDYGQHGVSKFSVRPEGIETYEQLKRGQGAPVDQVEAEVRRYLASEDFASRFPDAYAKWRAAEEPLWASEAAESLTQIGHYAREAMQAFATELVARHNPPGVDTDAAHDVARIRAVLSLARNQLGDTERSFFDALLAYWRSVSDLAQRQEHGAQREGKTLRWEDARRLVFQTLVVMYELDHSVRRALG